MPKFFHRISPHLLQKFTAFLTKIHRVDFLSNYCKKCGESGDCGEKNNSTLFTEFLTKIHHEIHRISYKNSPHLHLWQINVRNAVKAVNAVKKKIIHHFSPPFSQKFTVKPRPGDA